MLLLNRVLRSYQKVFKPKRYGLSAYDLNPDYSPLVTNDQFEINQFRATRKSRRCGLLGIKIGMTHEWDLWGEWVPLTVVWVDRCQVIQIKTRQTDGYNAIQLGVGTKSLNKVTLPLVGHYIKSNVPPKQYLKETRVTQDCLLPVGYQLSVRHLVPGQLVDVQGTSKGKGFAGGIKRWNFQRQPASHGNSKTTRQIGSTGQRKSPGRTFPGKKMPGNLGRESVTTFNMQVYKIDASKDLVFLKGAVPGPKKAPVLIRDAFIDQNKYAKEWYVKSYYDPAVEYQEETDEFHLSKMQHRWLPFPTFIEQPGIEYPDVLITKPRKVDPYERQFRHENEHVRPDEKE